jgi:hypothetical protein
MLGRMQAGQQGIILIHWWEESKLVQPLWKSVWWFLKNIKNRIPSHTTSGLYPKEPVDPCLLRHYSQQPNYRSRLDAHEWIIQFLKYGISSQWSFTQPLRRRKLCCLLENGWNWRLSC